MKTNHNSEVDLAVVGGGFMGVFAWIYLTYHSKISPKRSIIVDRHDVPLAEFRQRVGTCGMRIMRSSHTHHLHPEPEDLEKFADTFAASEPNYSPFELADETLQRPSVELFFAHANDTARRFEVARHWLQGTVETLRPTADRSAFELIVGDRILRAKRVILALGSGDNTRWPEWARLLQNTQAPIRHVLEWGFDLNAGARTQNLAVVGAGLTGHQVAQHAVELGYSQVMLIGPDRGTNEFDINPKFLRKEERSLLQGVESRDQRYDAVQRGVNAGEVMPAILARSVELEHEGRLQRVREAVESAEYANGCVVLHTQQSTYDADAVVLATGWNENVMAHPFLSGLACDYGLPTVVHGIFPDLDEALCWKTPLFPPTLHIAGLPAQLVVGPAGRNFVGARFAAKAIMRRM